MTKQDSCQILLAEDNPADVGLVREALQEHGIACRLHVVKDGAQAIAFVEDRDHDGPQAGLDLVLLDMHLPKYDGDEILKSIRSTQHFAHLPVVVMTASDSPHDHQAAERHAASHYFKKPSNLAQFMELGAIIRTILAGNAPCSPPQPRAGSAVGDLS